MRMPEIVSLEAKIDAAGMYHQLAEVLAQISTEFRASSQRCEELAQKQCEEEASAEPTES